MAEDNVLLDDFETFKDNFSQAIREENFEVQIDMTKKLGILAEHLGQEITRTELLPFIKENIDFHDEILLNLSEQLKQFIPLVGGYEHSQPVLDLLRKLCNTDETVVREKTIEALKSIADDLNCEQTEQLLLPVMEALANEDWFTSKCSAVALFPILYPKIREERKDELRHSFKLLSQDDSPIVRKAAAICLVDLIPTLDQEVARNEFIPVFDNISSDNMDSVQVHAIKIAIALSKKFTESDVEKLIFKSVENFADSNSWKIRQVLALHIAEIQEVIYFPKLRGKILAIFQKLIKDGEEEVRIMAVRNLVTYCRNLKISYEKQAADNNFESVFIQSIVPQIALLVVDSSVDVKLSLTRNILSLSTVVSKELFMEHIMPMVVDILEEENSVPVKAGILENLNDLPRDIDFAKSLPSIKKVVRTLIVYSQSHWRTRKSLLVTFMHIAKFATKEYFSENLKIFYASLLGDPVFAVRRTAPIILPLLAKQYGMVWTAEQIIPYFKMFTKDSRYLYRYVPLFGINELLNPSVVPEDELNYLKNLEESKDANTPKVLFKLKCLLMKLTSRLEEKTFKDILSLNKSIDDFRTDNIVLYAGETVSSLKQHYSQNIFSYSTERSQDWYLTGLISLIYRDFLNLILYLFDDKIVNVQIRSIFTLNKIKNFTDGINKEMEKPWVDESINSLTKEELETIEKEVEAELNEKPVEFDDDKIDTELMEYSFTTGESNLNTKFTVDSDLPAISIEYADDAPEIEIGEKDPTESKIEVMVSEDTVNTENSESPENLESSNSITEKSADSESKSESSKHMETENSQEDKEQSPSCNEMSQKTDKIKENIEKD